MTITYGKARVKTKILMQSRRSQKPAVPAVSLTHSTLVVLKLKFVNFFHHFHWQSMSYRRFRRELLVKSQFLNRVRYKNSISFLLINSRRVRKPNGSHPQWRQLKVLSPRSRLSFSITYLPQAKACGYMPTPHSRHNPSNYQGRKQSARGAKTLIATPNLP